MFLLLFLLGCFGTCETDEPLDHASDDAWLCKPGLKGPCPSRWTEVKVAEDGTRTEASVAAAADPDLACFVVYATVDLRPNTSLHLDTQDLPKARDWARRNAGPLAEGCTLWVPRYRQVTVGTYLGSGTDRKQTCLDSAYADVLSAFEAFLEAEPDRGIVLYGHSQGGQHLSRLIRERIETDEALRERLVAAYPLGWVLGTDPGLTVGGSFERTPVCTAAQQTGCVIGYRSYLKGEQLPERGWLGEGAEQVCTNPANPANPDGTANLTALLAPLDSPVVDTPRDIDLAGEVYVSWPNAFEATCRGDKDRRALEVRWRRKDSPPIDLGAGTLTGNNGSHILDVQLGVADVLADMTRRGAVWAERN